MIHAIAIRMTYFDLYAGLRVVAHLVATWHARFHQRLALAELEPRIRRDVGLTPGKAALEAAKPFWRA